MPKLSRKHLLDFFLLVFLSVDRGINTDPDIFIGFIKVMQFNAQYNTTTIAIKERQEAMLSIFTI